MPQKFQPIRFLDFSGGINSKVENHLRLDSEVALAVNVDLDNFGSLTKRKGYSPLAPAISGTDGSAILGNYYFNSTADTSDQHLVASTTDGSAAIFYNDSGTWVAQLGDLTGSTRVRFESFLDRVFEFNGAEIMKSWDGSATTSFDTTDTLDAPICKYGRVFQDKLFLANESSATTVNPSRLYWSSDVDTGSISFVSGTSYIDFNPEDGQSITGLDENSGRLLVFKDDSMFRLNVSGLSKSTEPDPIIDVGTTSQESVQTIHGITYFFNRYGVYVYNGGMPYLISRKIQDWIDAIDQTTLADIIAEVDNDHYYLSIGNVTVDSVAYSNVWLIYNIPLKAWTVWTTDSVCKSLAEYFSGGARYLSFGNSSGQVFRMNLGNSDNTEAIPVTITTKQYDLGMPEEVKKWTEVYVGTDKGKGIVEVGVNADNDSIRTIGSLDDDVTKLPSTTGGRKLGVTLSESGTGEPWKFTHLIFKDITTQGTK